MVNTKTYKTAMSKWLWIVLAAFLCLPVTAKAAEGFTNNELDTLVSTIALYPDPLLVHVLTAATYGDQIPEANAWAQAHKNLNGEALATAMENANLKYDPSVQALIPFPTVLATMAKYRTWSDQLGDAVSFQKDQVLDAIQRMRGVAYNYGHLKSDDQVVVTKTEKIIIEPTRTEYVYVPVYNPHVVYYVYADRYHPAVRYHHHAWLGTWYGEWGWGSCWFDWHYRYIYVRDYRWYPHRPIPHHPRRYAPPPRKAPHYRPAPAPSKHHAAPPSRHDDLKAGLKDRRRDDGRMQPNDRRRDDYRVQRDDRRPASDNRDMRARAASAKNNSASVVKERESVRNAPAREESRRTGTHTSAREEAKQRNSNYNRDDSRRSEPSHYESSRRSSSTNYDDNRRSNDSGRRSTSAPAPRDHRSSRR